MKAENSSTSLRRSLIPCCSQCFRDLVHHNLTISCSTITSITSSTITSIANTQPMGRACLHILNPYHNLFETCIFKPNFLDGTIRFRLSKE